MFAREFRARMARMAMMRVHKDGEAYVRVLPGVKKLAVMWVTMVAVDRRRVHMGKIKACSTDMVSGSVVQQGETGTGTELD